MNHISKYMPESVQALSETIPEEIIPKFSKSDLVIINASFRTEKNRKLGELSRRELIALATRIKKEASLRLGLKSVAETEESELIDAIVKLFSKHEHFTVSEIIFSADRGLDGQYLREGQSGVFFSVANLSIWIQEYKKQKLPVMAVHSRQLSQLPANNPKPPTDEELKAGMIALVNMHVDTISRIPDYQIPGASPLFDDLVRFGLLNKDESKLADLVRNLSNKFRGKYDASRLMDMAKSQEYNDYIKSLADFGFKLDENGERIDGDEN